MLLYSRVFATRFFFYMSEWAHGRIAAHKFHLRHTSGPCFTKKGCQAVGACVLHFPSFYVRRRFIHLRITHFYFLAFQFVYNISCYIMINDPPPFKIYFHGGRQGICHTFPHPLPLKGFSFFKVRGYLRRWGVFRTHSQYWTNLFRKRWGGSLLHWFCKLDRWCSWSCPSESYGIAWRFWGPSPWNLSLPNYRRPPTSWVNTLIMTKFGGGMGGLRNLEGWGELRRGRADEVSWMYAPGGSSGSFTPILCYQTSHSLSNITGAFVGAAVPQKLSPAVGNPHSMRVAPSDCHAYSASMFLWMSCVCCLHFPR